MGAILVDRVCPTSSKLNSIGVRAQAKGYRGSIGSDVSMGPRLDIDLSEELAWDGFHHRVHNLPSEVRISARPPRSVARDREGMEAQEAAGWRRLLGLPQDHKVLNVANIGRDDVDDLEVPIPAIVDIFLAQEAIDVAIRLRG